MFTDRNAWAIDRDAQVELRADMKLSDSIKFGATLIEKLDKGYKLVDQFGKEITKERVINMVNAHYNRASNVMTDNFIIQLNNISNNYRYYNRFGNCLKTNIGAIHAQLISIRNAFYEKDVYSYEIEEFDEFRSAGVLNVKEHTASCYRCKLVHPIVIVTDNVELFYKYYDGNEEKPSIVECYSNVFKFVFVKSLNNIKNDSNILYKLGATVNSCKPKEYVEYYNHDERRVEILHNLFGYDVTGEETPDELDEVVKFFCDHMEDSIDTTRGYTFLSNLVLPYNIKNKLDICINKLVIDGKLNSIEDEVFYEDSTIEEDSE